MKFELPSRRIVCCPSVFQARMPVDSPMWTPPSREAYRVVAIEPPMITAPSNSPPMNVSPEKDPPLICSALISRKLPICADISAVTLSLDTSMLFAAI